MGYSPATVQRRQQRHQLGRERFVGSQREWCLCKWSDAQAYRLDYLRGLGRRHRARNLL